jgi:DNA-binding HxlR family transcriptional regulator
MRKKAQIWYWSTQRWLSSFPIGRAKIDKRMVGGISQRMLTLTLRGLERDGLVKRTQFQTIPPRVDYELTQLGRSLWDAVEPLGAWAQGHVKHITRARAAFDEKINA